MFDSFPESSYDKEFVNMVSWRRLFPALLTFVQILFCTSSKKPLTFRKTRKSDWFSSPLRQHVLKSLPEREINLDAIRDKNADEPVLSDNNNPLGALQAAQGPHHWQGRPCAYGSDLRLIFSPVMREVLTDVHWETF